MPTPHLQIRVRDPRNGHTTEHRFTAATVQIGRDADNDLALADPHVSARHAVLMADDHGARLRDLGGPNGLRVAGRRLPPGATVPIAHRLCVTLGPFDLEIVHRPDRDHQATSGAVADPGPPDLADLHAQLRRLHDLHAPHAAARQAFEGALADLVHALHAAGDLAAARRVLAEFSPRDHAHLLLDTQRNTPPPPAPPDPPAPPPHPSHAPTPSSIILIPPDLSLRPAPAPSPPDLSLRPAAPHLARPPASHAAHAPPAPRPAAPHELALIADAARALLPGQRPPASLDEARDFLARLVLLLQTFAAGAGALQQQRLSQTRDLGLRPDDRANPLLAMTSADELLAHLLAARGPDGDRSHELLDGFTVLLAHARAHVAATVAATRHLVHELAPSEIDRHSAGPLRNRARWRGFVDRYSACVGDGTAVASALHDRFRSTYRDELERHGLPLADLRQGPTAGPSHDP